SVCEAMLARIRRSAPGTKIIFDPVDTHFQRLEREYRISGNKKTLRASERYRKLESRLARESDLVWCASTEDKHLMQAASPGTQSTWSPRFTNFTIGSPVSHKEATCCSSATWPTRRTLMPFTISCERFTREFMKLCLTLK